MVLLTGPLMIAVAIAPILWWRGRTRTRWLWFWAGALVFCVGVGFKFTMGAVCYDPLLELMSTRLPAWGYLVLGSLYGGSLTGVFEDGVTLAAALIWPRWAREPNRAVAIGLGAGGFEALFFGLCCTASILGAIVHAFAQAEPSTLPAAAPLTWLTPAVFRVIATLSHTSTRMLALLTAATRRWSFFCSGFLLATGIDAVAIFFDISGRSAEVSAWVHVLAYAPFAAVSVPIILWCRAHWPTPAKPAADYEI
jgi:uncharacterized membrane protein YhfC